MPWLILHKCNPGQEEPSDYGMMLKKDPLTGKPLSILACALCRERMIMQGDEVFSESMTNAEMSGNLPAGFTVLRTPVWQGDLDPAELVAPDRPDA